MAPYAGTIGTGARRVVEREKRWLEIGKRGIAIGTDVSFRKSTGLSVLGLYRDESVA